MIGKTLADPAGEAAARLAVERLALLAAAAALNAGRPRQVAELFAHTRFAAHRGATFGTTELDAADIAVLLKRVLPDN